MLSTNKRVRHHNIPGHAHELGLFCAQGKRFFTDPVACRMVCEEIQRARQMHSFKLLAYSILPGSAQLVIWPQTIKYNIAVIVNEIKGVTAARYQLYLNDNNAAFRMVCFNAANHPFLFWQPHASSDVDLRNSEAITDSIRWVEATPVRQGLVPAPHEWKWSSSHARHHNKGLVPDDISFYKPNANYRQAVQYSG